MNPSNLINLIGRLGQEPVRKNFNDGGSVLELSLATNNNYKDRNGNYVENTDWHRVKAYGPVVDTLERYLFKGDQVAIVGTLRYQEWTDKYEQKRKTAEIILRSFTLLSNKRQSGGEGVPSSDYAAASPPAPRSTFAEGAVKVVTPEPAAAENIPF